MAYTIIAALTEARVIGVGNSLPWHYPADLKRFKWLTIGHTVVMGRRTWDSLPKRPLPGRRNIVITRNAIDGAECFTTIEAALEQCRGDVWFIGGARIFAEAMQWADAIDLTWVPDVVADDGAVYFPAIDDAVWLGGARQRHPDDPRLAQQRFERRRLA